MAKNKTPKIELIYSKQKGIYLEKNKKSVSEISQEELEPILNMVDEGGPIVEDIKVDKKN